MNPVPTQHVGGKVVYTVGGAQVTQEERAAITLYRFSGSCSSELGEWIPQALGEVRKAAGLVLRDLSGMDAAFVQGLLKCGRDLLRRKRQIVLLAPPLDFTQTLERLGAADHLSILSGEGALLEGVSIAESVLKERAALSDLASRFEVNPLWRRFDQEAAWLCPICGTDVADVKLSNVMRPETAVLRGVRRHLEELCAAWRAGRRVPLPATILDSFLADINRRKTAEESERRERMNQEMETLQERVETIDELEHSMDAAAKRQMQLLPIDPKPDDVADIAVVYRPLQSVSGDFLDFYSLTDNRFGVSVGDVSGHGVEAAIVMGMAKMSWRVRSQATGGVQEMMTLANQDLFGQLRRSAFVTGFFGAIDRDTGKMTYVRAGHPPPLLRRRNGDCLELEGRGLPFGVDEGKRFSAAIELREIQLEHDDLLLLYTDGITEAGTPNQFGEERLRDAFLSAPADTPKAALNAVVGALDTFLNGVPLSDDVTLVCLKIR